MLVDEKTLRTPGTDSRASETSVSFHQTTRQNITEDSHMQTHRRESLKSHPSLQVDVSGLVQSSESSDMFFFPRNKNAFRVGQKE